MPNLCEEKKYLFSSDVMYNTMINNLREDPYFDGDELDIKLQGIIAKLKQKQKVVVFLVEVPF